MVNQGRHAYEGDVSFPTQSAFPEAWGSVTWERSRVEILDERTGEILFEMDDAEFPSAFSENARRIIASKYFRGTKPGAKVEAETSFKQVVTRVVNTIVNHAENMGILTAGSDEELVFENDLTYILLHQMAQFNSPVLFNVGVPDRQQQVSACYILGAEDDIEHIALNQMIETIIFKNGSGVGVNESPLRSSKEFLSTGGLASGPVSFNRGKNAWAGIIKSGGKTRRAARMVMLNDDHPDIEEFILSKAIEESKAKKLAERCGLSVADAYATVDFQNNNHTVRVSDDFMDAVQGSMKWPLVGVNGDVMSSVSANDLFEKIVNATWVCGDPGLQFTSAINEWATCSDAEDITGSNPCSEFIFLDDTSCNLASINLVKALDYSDGDMRVLRYISSVMTTAMEVLCDYGWYPHPRIGRKTAEYRPLGLGYANLGGYLMAIGYSYDSDEGREIAAEITAVITGSVYAQSARLAKLLGPFEKYPEVKVGFMRVIRKHRDAATVLCEATGGVGLAKEIWEDAHNLGIKYGFRNAQATVLAPTGTIGLAMDCETTGIEPELALVKYKRLIDGGTMKYANALVARALEFIGYEPEKVESICDWIKGHSGNIDECPDIEDHDKRIFLTSFPPPGSEVCLGWAAHISMMAAVQPFVSGAISKTVNLPESATPQDIWNAYMFAWRQGLKAVAVYRSGSKMFQPMSTDSGEDDEPEEIEISETHSPSSSHPGRVYPKSDWRKIRLSDDEVALRHKFTIGDVSGYFLVGLSGDGKIAEVFIRCSGGAFQGLLDWGATMLSLALQAGCPLEKVIEKSIGYEFQPAGITHHSSDKIRMAKSIIDYLGRHLLLMIQEEAGPEVTTTNDESREVPSSRVVRVEPERLPPAPTITGSICSTCGSLTVPNGACELCPNCGQQGGCG